MSRAQILRSSRVRVALGALAAVAVAAGALAASGVGDEPPEENKLQRVDVELQRVAPGNAPSVPGASAAAKGKKKKKKQQRLRSFVSQELTVPPGSGVWAAAGCPSKFVAVSGGVDNTDNAIGLLVSHSAPNNPETGSYSKNTWFAAATNSDAQSLHFRVVVNCLNKVK